MIIIIIITIISNIRNINNDNLTLLIDQSLLWMYTARWKLYSDSVCLYFFKMHLDPKPKDSDSEEEANVERKKPEGSRLAPQREKQVGNTSDVSCLSIKGV